MLELYLADAVKRPAMEPAMEPPSPPKLEQSVQGASSSDAIDGRMTRWVHWLRSARRAIGVLTHG